jgi:hypothetical protein
VFQLQQQQHDHHDRVGRPRALLVHERPSKTSIVTTFLLATYTPDSSSSGPTKIRLWTSVNYVGILVGPHILLLSTPLFQPISLCQSLCDNLCDNNECGIKLCHPRGRSLCATEINELL